MPSRADPQQYWRLFALAVIVTLAPLLHMATPFNHDEAWIMLSARRLLDGGTFGKDVIDINPPLAWWIACIPVWVARETGLSLATVATWFTALIAGASLAASDRLLETDSPFARNIVVAVAAFVLLIGPGYDFGQREHWMAILVLPYVLTRARRAEDAALHPAAAILIGIAAAIGVCLKPYFLLIPIALELWLLLRTRQWLIWLAPETWALAITGCAYGISLLFFAQTYLQQIVPEAIQSYWAYSNGLGATAQLGLQLTLPVMAVLLILFGLHRRNGRASNAAQALIVAGLAALAAAVLQKNAWIYHFLPAVIFLTLGAVASITANMSARTPLLRTGLVALLAVALFIPAITALAAVRDQTTPKHVAGLAAIFRKHAGPGRTVFGFITSPRDVLPAVLAADMRWAAPACCLFAIPAALRAGERPANDRAAIHAAARAQALRVVNALEARRPGVLVVDDAAGQIGFGGKPVNYLSWFEAHTEIAPIMRHYRDGGRVGPFHIYIRNAQEAAPTRP